MNNRIIILVLSTLLTACISNNPASDIYTLSPEWDNHNLQVNTAEKTSLLIKLAPVLANRALNGNEIFYTDQQYSWNSYVYSRWTDTPVKLLQSLFLVSIENSGLFKAVLPPSSVSKADLLLESNLLDLSHHIYDDGTSAGIIRMRFYLIDNKTRSVIATKEFVSNVEAHSPNAKAAVTALNHATHTVTSELVNWLAELNLL